jgi:hypothetical protein
MARAIAVAIGWGSCVVLVPPLACAFPAGFGGLGGVSASGQVVLEVVDEEAAFDGFPHAVLVARRGGGEFGDEAAVPVAGAFLRLCLADEAELYVGGGAVSECSGPAQGPESDGVEAEFFDLRVVGERVVHTSPHVR